MEVTARAAHVDERLGHEAREQAVQRRDLLRVRLVREVVVAAGEALDRREGELVLGRAPLLVQGARSQAERLQVADDVRQHGQALIRQRRRDVGSRRTAAHASRRRAGRTRTRPACEPSGPARPARSTWCRSTRRGLASTARPSAYSMSQITRAWPGRMRQHAECRQVGPHHEVGEREVLAEAGAGRELALVIPAEDVADECKAVLDEASEVVRRHGLAARHAVEVRRLEADELDRVRLEQLLDRVAVERCAHGRRRWDEAARGAIMPWPCRGIRPASGRGWR